MRVFKLVSNELRIDSNMILYSMVIRFNQNDHGENDFFWFVFGYNWFVIDP